MRFHLRCFHFLFAPPGFRPILPSPFLQRIWILKSALGGGKKREVEQKAQKKMVKEIKKHKNNNSASFR